MQPKCKRLLVTTIASISLLAMGSSEVLAHSVPVPPPAAGAMYTVMNGDSLFGIANRNGLKFGVLLRANGLTISSAIHPGQILRIPSVNQTVPTPATVPTTAASQQSAATTPIEKLVSYLRAQIGKPYKFFTAGPDTFDCSGLVAAGYKQLGLTLPHQSRMQAVLGAAIDWKKQPILAGDLIFMLSSSDLNQIGHVGIALDSTTWIRASGTGTPVRVRPLPTVDRIQAVRRIVP